MQRTIITYRGTTSIVGRAGHSGYGSGRCDTFAL